jgi:hypothetical protein
LGTAAGRHYDLAISQIVHEYIDRSEMLHHLVAFGKLADDAAVLKRDAIGIFEIDRPSPSVIDDVGGLYALPRSSSRFCARAALDPASKAKW